jgi:hypothetical protein
LYEEDHDCIAERVYNNDKGWTNPLYDKTYIVICDLMVIEAVNERRRRTDRIDDKEKKTNGPGIQRYLHTVQYGQQSDSSRIGKIYNRSYPISRRYKYKLDRFILPSTYRSSLLLFRRRVIIIQQHIVHCRRRGPRGASSGSGGSSSSKRGALSSGLRATIVPELLVLVVRGRRRNADHRHI